MKIIILFFTLFTSNIFCQNKAELELLLHDGKLNLVPRYGDGFIVKTSYYLQVDSIFILNSISEFGTTDSACLIYNSFGWDEYFKGNLTKAMKRFNQAWLLDSTNAAEYFGFSAILEIIKDNPNQFYQTSLVKIENVENPEKYYKIALQYDNMITIIVKR